MSRQCGLVTDTTVRSKGGAEDTSSAQGRIKVRVKITQPDGSIAYAEPNNGADLSGVLLSAGPGVTYCDRFQKLATSFAGLNCTADLTTGVPARAWRHAGAGPSFSFSGDASRWP